MAQRLHKAALLSVRHIQKESRSMKSSMIRALTLGVALCFPVSVFAQAGAGGAAAEKKDAKKMKAKDDTKSDAGGASAKKTKKSKSEKAEKAATGAAAKP
jgi:hypothetical protein